MSAASEVLRLGGFHREEFEADGCEVRGLEGLVSLLPVAEERRDCSDEGADVEVGAFGAAPLEADGVPWLVRGCLHV